MQQAPVELHHHDHGLQRLIVLSDAVFAIAMTLLALELRPPQNWDGTVVGLFTVMKVPLIAYAVSFLAVAAYWNGHRRSFGYIVKADGPMMVLSLLSLGLVTLVPSGARLLTEHGGASGAFPIYLGLVAAIGVVNALTWAYASLKPGLMSAAAAPHFRLAQFCLHLMAPLICWALYIIVASRSPAWGWMIIPLLFAGAFALRRWARHADRRAASPVDRHADDGLQNPAVGA